MSENIVLTNSIKKQLLQLQKNEITEYNIYKKIANFTKDEKNKNILIKISSEELKHYHIWETFTRTSVAPDKLKLWWYTTLAFVFGYTFALKLMESNENDAAFNYVELATVIPLAKKISEEENYHEKQLLSILDEERLQYVGSMVLGLNDALVELTGTLAGLTLALQNTRLIALSGLITGISATLSMASSEFLSARSEGRTDAFKSCIYTGITYCLTVALLVLPYLIFDDKHYLYALATMLTFVVLIIFFFTYYISVAKDLNFKKRFLEMATISLSVAAFSFVIGLLVKEALGIDI